MDNQLPMFVPGSTSMKNAVSNDTVGLSSDKLDESQITNTLFKYVASDKKSMNEEMDTDEEKEEEMKKKKAEKEEAKKEEQEMTGDKRHRGRFQPRSSTKIRMLSKQQQAPIPEGTVGRQEAMRKSILQLSLSPTIYRKEMGGVHHPGNIDFGEMD